MSDVRDSFLPNDVEKAVGIQNAFTAKEGRRIGFPDLDRITQLLLLLHESNKLRRDIDGYDRVGFFFDSLHHLFLVGFCTHHLNLFVS